MRSSFGVATHKRKQSGQALGLAAACALIVVMVSVGFLFLSLYIGGEQELNSATKSGALNVAVQMLNPNNVYANANGTQFTDVSDEHNKITLSNVNMVYAKALMIAANAQDIMDQGLSNGYTTQNLQSMIHGANDICRQLQQQVQNSNNIQSYFSAMSQNNSVRMFGGSSPQVAAETASVASNAWVPAFVYARTESNVTINTSQFPSSSSIPYQLVQVKGQYFFPGYQQLNAAGSNFCFIPFRYGGQPRLISPTLFNANLQAPSAAVTVLANAWSVEGMVEDGQQSGATTLAFAATNPEKTIPFQMQGYIRFTLNPNSYTLEADGEPCGEGEYGYGGTPVEVESTEFEVPICCLGQMQATFNLENEPGDLYSVLFPSTAINTGEDQVMTAILQRVREFCPSCTTANVAAALGEAMTTASSSTQRYYLYCSTTGKPSSLTCTSSPNAPAPFIDFNCAADSNPMLLAEQEFMVDDPNFADVEVEPEADCEGWGFAEVECTSSNLMWAPGTGYKGFLGEISLNRSWLASAECFCVVVPP